MNQIKEVVENIDIYFNNSIGYSWKDEFDEFEAENEFEARKKLLAKRLYHIDTPNIVRHKYIGSEKLKKRLIDTIIDKIFFIK